MSSYQQFKIDQLNLNNVQNQQIDMISSNSYTNTDDEIGRDHHSYRKLDRFNENDNSYNNLSSSQTGMMMYSPMLAPDKTSNKAAFFEIQIDNTSENAIEVSKEMEEQTLSSNINDFEFFSTFDSMQSPKVKQNKSNDKLLPVNLSLRIPDQSELTARKSKSEN